MSDFFRYETVNGASLPSDKPLARLRSGDLHAVLIQKVYASDEMAAAVSALEANAPGFERTDFPAAFQAFFYGHNLNLVTDLEAYFAAEPAFLLAMTTFLDLEDRITQLLSRLDTIQYAPTAEQT